MKLIRRIWTAQDADEWSREDWIAICFSPLAYILMALGVAGSFLMQIWGYLSLVLAIVVIIILHWIIDPKLKMISREYEKKQKDYLLELEKQARWEKQNG